MTFLHHRLENGLEVVAETHPQSYSMALAFFVATGSRDERDDEAGISHFLEHMAFKGTRRRSAEEVNRRLDEIGSHANAFTSEEETVYYLAALPEYQSEAVDILADMLRPALRTEDFDVEKQVILEEIKKYDDEPPYGAFDKVKALHFGRHPIARSVLGTIESVSALTPEGMRAYFDRRYVASNITVVAAGRVDFEALVRDLARLCGDWPEGTSDRTLPPAASTPGRQVVRQPQAAQEYVVELADGPAQDDPDRYAARVLATIVGDDSGSRFFWELVDTGRAETASMAPYEFEGLGIFLTYLCCDPEHVETNLQTIRRIEREVEAEGVTEEERERAVRKITSQIALAGEIPLNRLFAVGHRWLRQREYLSVSESVDRYRHVTLDDIARVLERFPISRCSTVAVGPREALDLDIADKG